MKRMKTYAELAYGSPINPRGDTSSLYPLTFARELQRYAKLGDIVGIDRVTWRLYQAGYCRKPRS